MSKILIGFKEISGQMLKVFLLTRKLDKTSQSNGQKGEVSVLCCNSHRFKLKDDTSLGYTTKSCCKFVTPPQDFPINQVKQ